MDLLDFARGLPTDFTEAEFIDELRKVVDLDQIRPLSDAECPNMYDAVAYLGDYLILLREFFRGQNPQVAIHSSNIARQ